jgi:hypothetical protein
MEVWFAARSILLIFDFIFFLNFWRFIFCILFSFVLRSGENISWCRESGFLAEEEISSLQEHLKVSRSLDLLRSRAYYLMIFFCCLLISSVLISGLAWNRLHWLRWFAVSQNGAGGVGVVPVLASINRLLMSYG